MISEQLDTRRHETHWLNVKSQVTRGQQYSHKIISQALHDSCMHLLQQFIAHQMHGGIDIWENFGPGHSRKCICLAGIK